MEGARRGEGKGRGDIGKGKREEIWERSREGWIGRGEKRADIGEGKRETNGREEGERRHG